MLIFYQKTAVLQSKTDPKASFAKKFKILKNTLV